MAHQSRSESSSLRKHRRELTWQIILPIIIVAILILTAVVFISLGVSGSLTLWRDISLIWLLLPALIMALLGMIVLVLAIYGMARLGRVTPRFTSKAQQIITQASSGIQKVALTSVKPLFWLGQSGAAIRTLFKR